MTTAEIAAALQASPPSVRKHAADVAQAATEKCPTAPLRWAWLLTGLIYRESDGGDALRPPGPAGWGDWGKRAWPISWFTTHPEVRRIAPVPDASNPGHQALSDKGEPMWWAEPPVGEAWAGGISQLDRWAQRLRYMRKLADGSTFAWTVPIEALRMGSDVLLEAAALWPAREDCMLAAYNCGVRNVRKALGLGLPADYFTTPSKRALDAHAADIAAGRAQPGGRCPGDYASWILAHVHQWSGQ